MALSTVLHSVPGRDIQYDVCGSDMPETHTPAWTSVGGEGNYVQYTRPLEAEKSREEEEGRMKTITNSRPGD